MESMAQQLLCPPVVVQTRPMEGCHTAVLRRSRRGRDVRTADDAVAVDIRPVSTASDTVVSRKIHRKSECVTTVVPKLAAAPQAAYEVVQPRPRDYGYTDSLPPGSPDRLQTELSVATTEMADIDICVVPDVLPIAMSVKTVMSDKSMEMDTPDGVVSRMEMTGGSPLVETDISRSPDMLQISVTATEIVGGSPPADIDIYVVPDMLHTEISVTTTEMGGGSPPADIDICVVPDVLPIAMAVKTVMSGKSMEMDTPDGVVSKMEMTGGSPPVEIDISRRPDMLQISVTATEIVGGSPPADIDIYVVPDMLQTEVSVTTTEMAGGSPPADIDICAVPDVLPTAISVKSVMSDKSSGIDTPDAVVSSMEVNG